MKCVIAVDIGAGSGSKIGLYDESFALLAEGFLPVGRYGVARGEFIDNLSRVIEAVLIGNPGCEPVGVGVVCPGIFAADGTALVVANIPMLVGSRLAEQLARRIGLPVWSLNDAAAGGLAEWSLAGHELVYWVLGGGWGGTWVDAEGRQVISPFGRSGGDADLNCVNEPGFVIPLYRDEIDEVLGGYVFSWDDLVSCLPNHGVDCSADGCEWVRAETVTASCGGLRRVFAMFLAKAGRESMDEAASIDPDGCESAVGGLAERGFAPAVGAEAVFVELWAVAVTRFYELAAAHGLTTAVPVHVAGGLTHISDRFLPALLACLRRRGIDSDIRISLSRRMHINANLLGAGQLALRNAAEAMGK